MVSTQRASQGATRSSLLAILASKLFVARRSSANGRVATLLEEALHPTPTATGTQPCGLAVSQSVVEARLYSDHRAHDSAFAGCRCGHTRLEWPAAMATLSIGVAVLIELPYLNCSFDVAIT